MILPELYYFDMVENLVNSESSSSGVELIHKQFEIQDLFLLRHSSLKKIEFSVTDI